MQKLYENFLHKIFYTRSNYSNRTVIHVNHTKIFLYENFYHEKFLHENKANYGSAIAYLALGNLYSHFLHRKFILSLFP